MKKLLACGLVLTMLGSIGTMCFAGGRDENTTDNTTCSKHEVDEDTKSSLKLMQSDIENFIQAASWVNAKVTVFTTGETITAMSDNFRTLAGRVLEESTVAKKELQELEKACSRSEISKEEWNGLVYSAVNAYKAARTAALALQRALRELQ